MSKQIAPVAATDDAAAAAGSSLRRPVRSARLPRAVGLGATAIAVLLAGCAARDWQTPGPLYRCEQNLDFRVKFIDDTAVLDGSRGSDVLYRDAGGQGPGQSVYANPRVRAEFGLGATGREAIVRYPLLPLELRCVRD